MNEISISRGRRVKLSTSTCASSLSNLFDVTLRPGRKIASIRRIRLDTGGLSPCLVDDLRDAGVVAQKPTPSCSSGHIDEENVQIFAQTFALW
jgi:hypothetical protein